MQLHDDKWNVESKIVLPTPQLNECDDKEGISRWDKNSNMLLCMYVLQSFNRRFIAILVNWKQVLYYFKICTNKKGRFLKRKKLLKAFCVPGRRNVTYIFVHSRLPLFSVHKAKYAKWKCSFIFLVATKGYAIISKSTQKNLIERLNAKNKINMLLFVYYN